MGLAVRPGAVLAEMRDVGIAATEFGPDGFLPDDPAEKAKTLADLGLRAVGGFVPVVLHDPSHDPLPRSPRSSRLRRRRRDHVGARRGDRPGGLRRPPGARRHRLEHAARQPATGCPPLAAERGVLATLHPHVGTMIENADDVDRVLRGSPIGLSLDTGHLLIGGVDPVALTLEHAAPDQAHASQGRRRRVGREGPGR